MKLIPAPINQTSGTHSKLEHGIIIVKPNRNDITLAAGTGTDLVMNSFNENSTLATLS